MPHNPIIPTLGESRMLEEGSLLHPTGELSGLLGSIALASVQISAALNRAGLAGMLGATGEMNIQGEAVQRLDAFANGQLVAALQQGNSCAGIASEELDDFLAFDGGLCRQSGYVCTLDPLDGSDNIDVNGPVGTIFGIFRRASEKGSPCTIADFLQPGCRQDAAGYFLYGPSTILVLATRRGVNGFTLDPGMGRYALSHRGIRCPASGSYCAFNSAHFPGYEKKLQEYILQQANWHGYAQRYAGCMAADLHRTLLKGGIFMYPGTKAFPGGKLRLAYECSPAAFVFEMAGGSASSGAQRILDIVPKALHERSPLFIGSTEMVEACR